MDVMRLDPYGVRSALLESVEPPDVPYDEMGNANLKGSLDVLFDACASDFECSRSYPDLRSAFAQTVQSLDRQPISITVKDTAGGKYQRPFTGQCGGRGVLRAQRCGGHTPPPSGHIRRVQGRLCGPGCLGPRWLIARLYQLGNAVFSLARRRLAPWMIRRL